MNGARLNRGSIQSLAIISLLISVTVALPLTTNEIRAFSVQARGMTLALTALSVALLAFTGRGNWAMILSMSAFVLLYLYGLLMAAVMGGISTALTNVPTTILLTMLGLFIASQRQFVVNRGDARILVLYVFTFMAVTVFFGGLVLSMPPYFVFQVQSDGHGSLVYYSQGVSKFFGLGLVLCSFLLQSEYSIGWRVFFLLMSLFFLLLSFIGGGRGDALAALIVFLFIFMIRMPLKAKIPITIVVLVLGGLFLSNININDMVIFARLSILLEGSVGARDAIYNNAILLLLDQLQCMLIGCGFDYFQHALQVARGQYPHNQVLEAMIVWGIPLTIILMIFFLIGLYKSFREKGEDDAFPYIAMFFVIVAMKSGSIASSWIFIIAVFHYIGVGLERILVPKKN